MRNLFSRFTHWYFSKDALSFWLVLLMDCSIVVGSSFFVHAMVTCASCTLAEFGSLLATFCAYLIFYIIGFKIKHTYSGVLRYSSFVDLVRLWMATIYAVSMIFILRHITNVDDYLVPLSWSELLAICIMSSLVMSFVRIMTKYLYDIYFVGASVQRVFIYGVKEGGVALAKSIQAQESKYEVTGFVSDVESDAHHLLMGVKIYVNDDKLVSRMRQKNANVLMVSPLKSDAIRNNQQMADALAEAGIKILMYNQQEWDGKSDIKASQLREIQIEDLLHREEIDVDMKSIENLLKGKRVFITGSAGSIGSEMVRQIAKFDPEQLILIDEAETPQHDIRLMLKKQFPHVKAESIVTSITKHRRMESLFKMYRPDYVFHAAAYKHVPMMEDNPSEAVHNNIDGTRVIADLSVKYGVKKFVMVSTDKAVNPTNVMGCSKRICEIYVQSLDKAIKDGKVEGITQFVTTRFGNVLGSNGSVIPLFREQIKNGGPITVTHPDIVRFFMLIPEACKLVLEAGTMGKGGEIFVFDMGKPVKIYELASGVKIQEPEKKHTVVTVSLNNDVRDGNYKVYTLEEDKKEKKPYRLVIDIFPPNPMKQKIYGVEGHSIVLDPGHGGSDSGAIGPHGVQEKDITLVVAMKTKELLEKSGANVIMTRETDCDVYGINATDRQELQARVNVGERARKAEVFVSIHCNAFSNANAHGMETYYYGNSYRGRKLATFLNEELAEFGGLSNRGILTANFYVLKHSRMPGSLIELGFITNYEEEAYLDDEEYQDRLAFAIANALGRYFQ